MLLVVAIAMDSVELLPVGDAVKFINEKSRCGIVGSEFIAHTVCRWVFPGSAIDVTLKRDSFSAWLYSRKLQLKVTFQNVL